MEWIRHLSKFKVVCPTRSEIWIEIETKKELTIHTQRYLVWHERGGLTAAFFCLPEDTMWKVLEKVKALKGSLVP